MKKKFIYYYLYLVVPTNKKSNLCGKVYYGQHRTNNLNDGYIGSGYYIRQYLKKYPNDYYREMIAFYHSEEDLNKAEYELIHPHLGKYYCMNLSEGGGFKPHLQKDETKRKIGLASKGNKSFLGKHHSEETKQHISQKLKGVKKSEEYINKYLKGRSCSEETRKKIAEKQIGIKRRPRTDEEKKLCSKATKGKKTMYKDNNRKYVYPNDEETIQKLMSEGWSFTKLLKTTYKKKTFTYK